VLRRWAEIFSRDVVLKRRLSSRFGRAVIYVSPDSALRLWRFNLESTDRELVEVASSFILRDMVVWDVGANVGLFSFCAAALGARVYALEPDIFLVSLLRRSARKNGLAVTPIPVAISDHCGLVDFNIAERGRSANFVTKGRSDTGGVRRKETAPCVTLDWLAETIPVPDFIKIDVENSENAVLTGGTNLLLNKHPMIFCEVSEDPSSRERTTDLFHAAGYSLFNVKNDTWVEKAVWSTLAVFGDSVRSRVETASMRQVRTTGETREAS
jgi:FkbM family methyltransferase